MILLLLFKYFDQKLLINQVNVTLLTKAAGQQQMRELVFSSSIFHLQPLDPKSKQHKEFWGNFGSRLLQKNPQGRQRL